MTLPTVYAQRTVRRREGLVKRILAYCFYRFLRLLTDVDIPADTGDFCLMDRQVVDVLNSLPERGRYLRGLRAWVGFRQTAVTFERTSALPAKLNTHFANRSAWPLTVSFLFRPYFALFDKRRKHSA